MKRLTCTNLVNSITTKRWICSLVLALCVAGALTAGQLSAQTWKVAGPAPRLRHTSVVDAAGRMIMFGGSISDTNVPTYLNTNDVWRLNTNLTWTALTPTGTLPTGRSDHAAVYDTANNRMIIFGGAEGNASPCANDVWVLTDANGITGTPAWTQLAPVGTVPSPRGSIGAGYDPNTNSMIVYGGHNCFAVLPGDVFVLSNANGLGGTPTWTQLSPAGGGPGGREINGGVAYDAANNRLIVFGGASTSGDNNDTWVLTNANGQGGTPTWIQLAPSGTLPAARDSNSTVYDPKSNRLTIFGGANSAGVLQDSWVLTNANGLGGTPVWTQLGPFSFFSQPRWGHTGVYNPKKNVMTIFGGNTFYNGVIGINTNDVWVLNHANGK